MVVCRAALEDGWGGGACKQSEYVDMNNEVMIYAHDEDIM